MALQVNHLHCCSKPISSGGRIFSINCNNSSCVRKHHIMAGYLLLKVTHYFMNKYHILVELDIRWQDDIVVRYINQRFVWYNLYSSSREILDIQVCLGWCFLQLDLYMGAHIHSHQIKLMEILQFNGQFTQVEKLSN